MKKLWKKISCFCLAASILLSLCPAFLTPALGAENIQWFYYQDFSGEKTDEKFGLDHVFPADGSTIQKIEENGVDFLRLLPNDKAGTQISKWIPQVPGKPKMVLQFRQTKDGCRVQNESFSGQRQFYPVLEQIQRGFPVLFSERGEQRYL